MNEQLKELLREELDFLLGEEVALSCRVTEREDQLRSAHDSLADNNRKAGNIRRILEDYGVPHDDLCRKYENRKSVDTEA